MKLAVVVLAAGKGTRMKSDRAKVLHAVAGRPMIEYPVELARSLSADRIVCVLGHQADEVKRALDARFGAGAVEVALQAEQKGTGHAVACAEPALAGFDGRVLILYGDTPLLTRELLVGLIEATGGHRLGLVTFRPPSPHGYGRIVRDAAHRLHRIVEEKDTTLAERAVGEVNAGIYCVTSAFLFPSLRGLGTNNAQGELYLTDVVAQAAAHDAVQSVEADPEEVAGVNDRVDLARADAAMRRRLVTSLMREGATVISPETVFVEPGVTVGTDSEIGPGVQLRGRTRLGRGVRVDAGCVLTDAVIGDGTHLKPYCVVSESTVGQNGELGPFAHLRPGSDIGDQAKVGNFVETKKARLGRGAKASHLSYLGDCEVGAGANIGCGTITCNYDGYTKSKTVIGEGAFIGSDTQLVAPVTVGARAVVAAGTTVVEDVPDDALAISREKQQNVEGWATRKRQREADKKAQRGG
jgi:bifunctional UDP-N-acetylglucosamine pyrophosphorylase/glucosamine-1-phosphate N-acetyltransferase